MVTMGAGWVSAFVGQEVIGGGSWLATGRWWPAGLARRRTEANQQQQQGEDKTNQAAAVLNPNPSF